MDGGMVIVNGFYLQNNKVISPKSKLPIDHPNEKTIADAAYRPFRISARQV